MEVGGSGAWTSWSCVDRRGPNWGWGVKGERVEVLPSLGPQTQRLGQWGWRSWGSTPV